LEDEEQSNTDSVYLNTRQENKSNIKCLIKGNKS